MNTKRIAAVTAVLVTLAAVIALAVVGCGSTTVITTAPTTTTPPTTPTTTTIIQKAPKSKTVTTTIPAPGAPATSDSGAAYDQPQGSADGPPSGAAPCGDDTYVIGGHTSCSFAVNVETASDGSVGVFTNIYSPVTGDYYTMTCFNTGGGWIECEGGTNDAANMMYLG